MYHGKRKDNLYGLKTVGQFKQWGTRKGTGKASSEEGKKLNNYLEDIRNELGDCYRHTGMAYIDVMQLTPNNIILGIYGNHWIKTIREKTDTTVDIPM